MPLPAMAGMGLAGMALVGTTVTLRRDQSLFLAGDAASHVYRVMAGCVRSLALMPDGRRQVAEFHLPGDLLGLDGREAHLLSAEAVGDAILLRFPAGSWRPRRCATPPPPAASMTSPAAAWRRRSAA
ncbi:cyclic nucleotide-binding domain-containing protein [Pseudoroseomonas wenyumeiae]